MELAHSSTQRCCARAALLVLTLLASASPAVAAVVAATGREAIPEAAELRTAYLPHIHPLLAHYCLSCHDGSVQDIPRLDTLAPGLTADNVLTWNTVRDVLEVGSMPKGKLHPSAAELEQLLGWVEGSLGRYDADHHETGGDTLLRRINNRAYANMIHTLLGVPAQGMAEFPADGTVRGYDTVGSGLFMSEDLLEHYQRCARATLDAAIITAKSMPAVGHSCYLAKPPLMEKFVLTREESQRLLTALAKDPVAFKASFSTLTGPHVYDLQTKLAQQFNCKSMAELDARKIDWIGDAHSSKIRAVLELDIASNRDKERDSDDFQHGNLIGGSDASESGMYHFRAVLCASDPRYPIPEIMHCGDQAVSFMVCAPRQAPFVFETTVFVKKGPCPYNVELYIAPHDNDFGHPDAYVPKRFGPNAYWPNPYRELWKPDSPLGKWVDPRGPGADALLSEISVSGPYYDAWPPPAVTQLFPHGIDAPPTRAYAEEIVASFMRRAYAGAAEPELVRTYADLVMDKYARSKDFVDAVKFGVAAILSSPQFLFLDEPQRADPHQRRPLTGRELARRLAYVLWSDQPDDELLAQAASGALAGDAGLRAQTRRMLADPRSQAFCQAFATQWLKLGTLRQLPFSQDLFPDFDEVLRQSALQEPIATFSEVLGKNLPITDLIDADFAMLDYRLASHYGIAGVDGNGFRRVQLPPGSHRGGVLTQAAVMMATSNGMVGSPVRRGALIMERLLGVSPGSPPPNVPALDKVESSNPDGSPLTQLERLAKHRSNAGCARCHDKIDPLGAGLENYNALGAWSDQLALLDPGLKTKAHWIAHAADVRGRMLDGAEFDGPDQLKRRLLEHTDQFRRALAENLAIYALGRELQLSDGLVINTILERAAADHDGLRSLLEQLILSDLFRSK